MEVGLKYRNLLLVIQQHKFSSPTHFLAYPSCPIKKFENLNTPFSLNIDYMEQFFL